MSVSVKRYFPKNPLLSDDAMVEGYRLGTAILNDLRCVVFALPLSRDRLLYLSPSAADLYGEPVDLLIDHPNFWLDAIHPEDKPAVWLGMEKLRDADHGEMEFHYRIVASDGDVTWVTHHSRLANSEGGVPVRIDFMIAPCAQPARPAVHNNHSNALFTEAADAMLVRDASSLRILDANGAALSLLHCGRAELLRQDLADLSARTEGFNARAEQTYIEAARHGRPQRYDWLLAPREGAQRWVNVMTSAFHNGSHDCLLSVLRDVDVDRKERDRQAIAADLVDHCRDTVAWADPAGQVRALNAAGHAFLGLTPEAIYDLFLTDLLPAWAQPHFLHTCLPLATKDGIWRGEMALVSRNGHSLPVMLTLMAHKQGGALRGYSLIGNDISSYKLALQRQKRDKEELQADMLLKEKLLENVSASLIHPLDQLRQLEQILKRNPADLERALPHMHHAIEQARRLVDATTEFLKHGAQRDLLAR